MAKFTDDELKVWFGLTDCNKLTKSDKNKTDILVKIPYKKDFDLLYYSYVWNEDDLGLEE